MKRLVPLLLLAAIAGAYVAYQRYLAGRPFEWAGTVEARAIAVGSRTGGRVAKVLVQEGERVKPGQVLVELEHGDLDAQRAGAAAQLAQAEAALDKLKAGARPEEIAQAQARTAQATAVLQETRKGSRAEEIAAAEARVAQAQAGVDKAQLDAQRARRLLESQAIAKAEADATETALRTAVAQRDALQKVLDQLRAGARAEEKALAGARVAEAQAAAKLVMAGARVEDLRAAQAVVDAARARLAQLDITIGELQIKAPAAALVEALQLRPGDILPPNATAATLLEDGQLYVRLYVPETQIGRIAVGQQVPITVDSFDRTFTGKVEHINAQGEYSPRNLQTADERADQVFAARIGLVDGQNDLRAGMAAMVRIDK
ncbi:MAG: HlyD family efflux transporter periplasmic adaptor subunit [Myxococcales bacterium]|nr:HlyD family efflux transporter periplasmic adaptor subunit [Myxococcales bacterium]